METVPEKPDILELDQVKQLNWDNYKLPEDFKQQWIKDLRSGEFKQGENQLYISTTDSYCCLGVCSRNYTKSRAGEAFINSNYVPNSFPRVLMGQNPLTMLLAYLNDGIKNNEQTYQYSFEEIARLIEEKL